MIASTLPPLALANPGPLWQWVGIVVTCAGTLFGLVGLYLAYTAARDAERAAKGAEGAARAAGLAADRARQAAERRTAAFSLTEVEVEAAEVVAVCDTGDLDSLRRALTRLATHLNGVADLLAAGDADDLIEEAEKLRLAVASSTGSRKADSTLRRDLASTVVTAQGTMASVRRTLRQDPPSSASPNDEQH